MELNEFLEKFLPDYEVKKIIVMCDLEYKSPLNDQQRAILILSMFTKYFTEIMQNCIDKACEKQRENCKAAYWNFANVGSNIEIVFHNILNAEQPKIEELI